MRSAPRTIDLEGAPQCDGQVEAFYFHRGNRHWFRPPTLADAQELKGQLAAHFWGRARASGRGKHGPRRSIRGGCGLRDRRLENRGAQRGPSRGGGTRRGCLGVDPRSCWNWPTPRSRPSRLTAQPACASWCGTENSWPDSRSEAAGSVGGNIAITKAHTRQGEPFPSDLFTVLATLGATVSVRSTRFEGGERTFELDELPPLEDLPSDALFVRFQIPWSRPGEFVQTFRVARRPQMAHPIVNAGFRCRLDAEGRAIAGEVVVVFGGLASCNARMPEIEATLAGRRWDSATLREALPALITEVEAVTIPMEGEGFTPRIPPCAGTWFLLQVLPPRGKPGLPGRDRPGQPERGGRQRPATLARPTYV